MLDDPDTASVAVGAKDVEKKLRVMGAEDAMPLLPFAAAAFAEPPALDNAVAADAVTVESVAVLMEMPGFAAEREERKADADAGVSVKVAFASPLIVGDGKLAGGEDDAGMVTSGGGEKEPVEAEGTAALVPEDETAPEVLVAAGGSVTPDASVAPFAGLKVTGEGSVIEFIADANVVTATDMVAEDVLFVAPSAGVVELPLLQSELLVLVPLTPNDDPGLEDPERPPDAPVLAMRELASD